MIAIVIVKADKGNAVVVLDIKNYVVAVDDLLKEYTFR